MAENCKYEIICKWYSTKCYEPKCWRAIFLDDIIPSKHLKTLELLLNDGQTKSNGVEESGL